MADAEKADLSRRDVSDETLIERAVAGNRDAFDVLYNRYFPRVFRFTSRRISNRADVEETVQEIFLSVFSSLGSFRAEAPFGAWVLGVSRRTIAGRFKKKQLPVVPFEGYEEEELALAPLHREPTPLEQYEYTERLELLQEAAELRLSAEQRHLFELHHIRHLSIQEIARFFKKSEDAVKSHLYRARKLLLAR